jgi:hypothetical protein
MVAGGELERGLVPVVLGVILFSFSPQINWRPDPDPPWFYFFLHFLKLFDFRQIDGDGLTVAPALALCVMIHGKA